MYDFIIVGSGFAGVTAARLLAEKGNNVIILEKKSHISGNMYDYVDENNIRVHKYGPHILMTDNENVISFLSRFTEWLELKVNVETYIDGKYLPLPINLNSIEKLYEKQGKEITKKLLSSYKLDEQINILDLLNSDDQMIKDFAEDIYNKVFLGYNVKMWGMKPTEIDKEVVGRSPIRITYQNQKTNCKYQVVPKNGYIELFNKMVDHPNIDVQVNTDANEKIKLEQDKLFYNNKIFNGKVIWTAPIDELFNYKYGEMPYRSIYFKKEIINSKPLFSSLSATYPMNYKKIRSSNMNKITYTGESDKTVIVSEYSSHFDKSNNKYNVPSYPIINENNLCKYEKYKKLAKNVANFYIVGRLAEFKYYDMSQVIQATFDLVEKEGL